MFNVLLCLSERPSSNRTLISENLMNYTQLQNKPCDFSHIHRDTEAASQSEILAVVMICSSCELSD
jgi:hypothetical protein